MPSDLVHVWLALVEQRKAALRVKRVTEKTYQRDHTKENRQAWYDAADKYLQLDAAARKAYREALKEYQR